MRFQHTAALALGILLPCSALADTPFGDSIPTDLAVALLGGGGPEVTLYADIPDSFPEFTLPDGTEVIGAIDRVHSQQVVLRTESPASRQRQLLMQEFEQRGYTYIERTPPRPSSQRGFVAPFSLPDGMPVHLCHEQNGMMMIMINGVGNEQMLILQTFPDPQQSACNAQERQGGPFSGFAVVSLHQYLPLMSLPQEATIASGRQMGFTTSNARTQTNLNITLDWPLDELEKHIADQLTEQDWTRDSQGAGEFSAVSTWTTESEDGQLLGTLQIVRTAASEFELLFALQVLPEEEAVGSR